MCCEPCTKLGMNWEERILRLHWTVHAVVHTQHFINKHNVKCKPYGPWGHYLGQCTPKLITLSLRRLQRACGAPAARRKRSLWDGLLGSMGDGLWEAHWNAVWSLRTFPTQCVLQIVHASGAGRMPAPSLSRVSNHMADHRGVGDTDKEDWFGSLGLPPPHPLVRPVPTPTIKLEL